MEKNNFYIDTDEETNANAHYVDRMMDLTKYSDKGIHLIEPTESSYINKLPYRDAYFNIVNKINSGKYIGKAICIVGLRRTGKSILLNHLHINSKDFGISSDEVLHITLSSRYNGKDISRDDIDKNKIGNKSNIEFPTLDDLQTFIKRAKILKNIKCIMIDEVTLCEDLILCGQGFVDSIVNSGIILILAGTESASFNLANKNSLYTRVILEDVSYIPMGEYCRLKNLSLSSSQEKKDALYQYIKHGNILDDTTEVDDKYLENALGVNVALSIVNSDFPEFIGEEHNTQELVQSIVKYFKLIGEQIDINRIKAEITRANLTKPLNNINARRRREDTSQINIGPNARTQLVIQAAEEVFKAYALNFGISKIPLTNEQLYRIDELFSSMGLIYNLSIIPEDVKLKGAVDADDLTTLHSLNYTFLEGIADKILSSNLGISVEDAELLADEVKSTVMGDLIEGIIAIQLIKGIEKEHKLLTCLKKYKDNSIKPERKCTKCIIYKYRNRIDENGKAVEAEIDLVLNKKDSIQLIEIKKSEVVDEHQTRWLNNETVIAEIQEKLSKNKTIAKYVYYLGEDTVVGDVTYKNIVDILIKHYERYLKSK